MRRRTKVDKAIDLLEEILNDHHFVPTLFANMVITSYPPYTQARLMELIRTIEKYHNQELELERKTQTGHYTNNNPQITNKPETDWIHDNQYQSPSYNMQRNNAF